MCLHSLGPPCAPLWRTRVTVLLRGRLKKGDGAAPSPSTCRIVRPAGPSRWMTLCDHPMLFGGLRHNVDRHVLAAELAIVESDAAVGERKEGVVLAEADVGARIDAGAALAHEDVAADHFLATELLHAEATAG